MPFQHRVAALISATFSGRFDAININFELLSTHCCRVSFKFEQRFIKHASDWLKMDKGNLFHEHLVLTHRTVPLNNHSMQVLLADASRGYHFVKRLTK